MSLFKSLFHETKHENKKLKLTSSVKELVGALESIPMLHFPLPGSQEFNSDLNEVIDCYNNQCLHHNFLNKSHESVSKTFKHFLDQEYGGKLDWHMLSKILDEVGDIITILKKKYKRERPKHFLKHMSNDYENIKKSHSYSFPSGHTACAFFLCNVLSEDLPNLKHDLKTLAELIGQSRIDNGVHFPSDVLYGKLVGEILADFYHKQNIKENVNLKEIAISLRSNLSQQKALEMYAKDISEFLFNTLVNENIKCDFFKCKSAAFNFLEGLPPEYASDDVAIKSLLESIQFLQKSKITCVSEVTHLNNLFSKFSHNPIRHRVLMTESCSPKKILKNLNYILENSEDAISKKVLFDWIKPFEKFNNSLSSIILLADLNFNFDITNQVINELQDRAMPQNLSSKIVYDILS
jgi:hypothetical protein